MANGWNYQGMGGGGWALMVVGMLVFWTILVVGVVVLWRHFEPRRENSPLRPSADTAVEILKERFARGELTEEEYVQRRKLLKDRP